MTIMLTDLLNTRWKASQVAQWVVNLPAIQNTPEMWVQFLSHEDPLEEGTATHLSILACRIPWTEEPAWFFSPWGRRDWHDWSDWAQHTEHRGKQHLMIKYLPFLFVFLLERTAFTQPPDFLLKYCQAIYSIYFVVVPVLSQSCMCVFVFLISYIFVSMSF